MDRRRLMVGDASLIGSTGWKLYWIDGIGNLTPATTQSFATRMLAVNYGRNKGWGTAKLVVLEPAAAV